MRALLGVRAAVHIDMVRVLPETRTDMDSKKKKLQSKGWTVGNASDFLELSPEEVRYIELKLALDLGF